MKIKTKEQVQEYFKNAKVIKDKYGDIIHYNNFKLEDIYNDNFDDWIVEDESKDSDILLYCYIKGYAEITEFKETQIPALEEVRKHFKDAKVIKSHNGIKFKGFNQLHIENEKYYVCDESGNSRNVWRKELGYAEIIEYKEPVKETPENDFKQITDSISDLLEYKNKKYGRSALNPIKIFEGKTKVGQRLDDKISRIKNSDVLRKNDIGDAIGYLILVCKENNWNDFSEFKD